MKIDWSKLHPIEMYLEFSVKFRSFFIGVSKIVSETFNPINLEPGKPYVYNPEIMKNFPYNKFNWYVFIAYLINQNFVLIKTSLGSYYFRWVKSLNSTVKIHGEKVHLSDPPIWITILHLVDTKKMKKS